VPQPIGDLHLASRWLSALAETTRLSILIPIVANSLDLPPGLSSENVDCDHMRIETSKTGPGFAKPGDIETHIFKGTAVEIPQAANFAGLGQPRASCLQLLSEPSKHSLSLCLTSGLKMGGICKISIHDSFLLLGSGIAGTV
jgi:hypothetical protein